MCGDFLYATAFNMLARDGDIEVIRTMAQASSQVCEGEVLELQLAFNPEVTEEQCIEIARLKTAELMAAACKIGAMASGANGKLTSAVESFGRNIGIAFQIVDDVLDMEGSVEEIGKPVGSDLLEGKITLPVRLTLDALPEEKRAIWEQRIAKRELTPQDAADLAKFARENRVLEQARARAEKFAEKALEQLMKMASEVNSSEAINMLKRLARFFRSPSVLAIDFRRERVIAMLNLAEVQRQLMRMVEEQAVRRPRFRSKSRHSRPRGKAVGFRLSSPDIKNR
jgi:geranylgeranyl diphosphate synthase type I